MILIWPYNKAYYKLYTFLLSGDMKKREEWCVILHNVIVDPGPSSS